jgi:AraC-like DNA-binding protein
MIITIQIIALLQGLFVLSVLFNRRREYKEATFWLLFGSLSSIVLYILGDDQNNLFVSNADWFLFDSSLFVTFFFLFFKYWKSGEEKFNARDYFYFIPNFIYFIIEGIEIAMASENLFIEILEIAVELTFVLYLFVIVYHIFFKKKKHWIIYFTIPIAIVFTVVSLKDFLHTLGIEVLTTLEDQNTNTYLLLVIAFLFYFIAFKLLGSEKSVLPKKEKVKYKNSNLTTEQVDRLKSELLKLMEVEKFYLNNKLSIQDVAVKIEVPRQYLSEVLNLHLNISFQDFVNNYRVEEFIDRLQKDQNKHFTLLGIAMDVGFSSKSSFNTTFKRIKGLTPTQYKKTVLKL